jgi:hypothetical protein
MAIRNIITRGFGNGVFSGSIAGILKRGFEYGGGVSITVSRSDSGVVIEEADRKPDGRYLLDAGAINIFPFEILPDKQFRVPVKHLNTNAALHATFSIRAWISETPYGSELFFRYHPGTGGVTHIFYDKGMNTPPIPIEQPPMRNSFSGITFVIKDELVPLTPGVYYYNVINMENKDNSYELFFDPFEF